MMDCYWIFVYIFHLDFSRQMTMGWKRFEESTGNDIERFDAKNQFEVFV